MRKQNLSDRYAIVIALFIYMILSTGVIAGQNLINVFGLTIATGMLIFPLTYIFIAVSTELYGARKTREIILCSAICNIIMVLIIYLFTKIPSERSFIGDSDVYHAFSNRIIYLLMVSTVAFMISENLNVWIISKLKMLTRGRMLILRAFLSTSCAIIIDTWLVFPFFLSRQADLMSAILETFIVIFVKIAYDLALLPVFWIIISIIRHKCNEEVNSLPGSAMLYTSSYYLDANSQGRV